MYEYVAYTEPPPAEESIPEVIIPEPPPVEAVIPEVPMPPPEHPIREVVIPDLREMHLPEYDLAILAEHLERVVEIQAATQDHIILATTLIIVGLGAIVGVVAGSAFVSQWRPGV